MKFISAISISFALVCGSVYAQGTEEICHISANNDVELKKFFNSNPKAFPRYLELIEERKDSTQMKARLRERVYWVYNRRSLSDDDIQRLSFIRSLVEMQ